MTGMRKLILFIAALTTASCAAQSAGHVTIFAPGSIWKGGAKRTGTLGIARTDFPSMGFVFLDGEKAAKLMTGRFITLNVPSGEHHIGGDQSPKPKQLQADIDLVVEPGQSYFLQLTDTSKGAWIVQMVRVRLDQVDCETARQGADTTKPVQVRLVDKKTRALLVDSQYFPQCSVTP